MKSSRGTLGPVTTFRLVAFEFFLQPMGGGSGIDRESMPE